MNRAILSLEQSPPLSVPAPYFLLAPLFAAAAGLLLVWQPVLLQSRWHPGTLALTHLLTLGFFALVMVGAFQQLLPVLAGALVPKPVASAWAICAALVLGTAALAAGLAMNAPLLLRISIVSLGAGFAAFLAVGSLALFRSPSRHPTIRAMGMALAALAFTATLGLFLAGGHGGLWMVARQWTGDHLAWGGLGWIALLVTGVAWQVVPMFQVTPEYPRVLVRWLAPALVASLLLSTVPRAMPWSGLPAAFALGWFGVVTLELQRARRRRLPDVTVAFWRLGTVALIAAALVWFVVVVTGWPVPALLLGALFLAGFAMSAVEGMLYKIVPFLIWLHLNNLKFASGSAVAVPTMKQVVPEARARWQFRAHALALCFLFVAVVHPAEPLVRAAGLAFTAAAVLLAINIGSALLLYRRVRRECVAQRRQ